MASSSFDRTLSIKRGSRYDRNFDTNNVYRLLGCPYCVYAFQAFKRAEIVKTCADKAYRGYRIFLSSGAKHKELTEIFLKARYPSTMAMDTHSVIGATGLQSPISVLTDILRDTHDEEGLIGSVILICSSSK